MTPIKPTKASEAAAAQRSAELTQAARAAAAEVVEMAAAAATRVTDTAANTARVLVETTKLDLQYIKDDLQEIKKRLDEKYVTSEAFEPVRRLVYGLVALLLAGTVGGLLALIIRTPPH